MEIKESTDFERTAQQDAGIGLGAELWLFLRDNKKWWLLPILGVMILFGLLLLLGGTGAAPFIYTLF